MTQRAWKLIDWLFPAVLAAGVTYFPQVIAFMQARGGWWAIAGTVLLIVGRAGYQAYNEPKT